MPVQQGMSLQNEMEWYTTHLFGWSWVSISLAFSTNTATGQYNMTWAAIKTNIEQKLFC